ncbi:MAG TPA: virulence RhuM family protein [Myxococcota bacterium]|nr:virulence RhuM family protein [Myxococcota bacterium]
MSELPPNSKLILYQPEDGDARIVCRLEGETIWLTQAQMAELFQIGVGTVNHHLKELYGEGELAPDPTIRRYRIVRTEGDRSVSREIEHYSLDAILAVGYRVRSHRGTQFRQWATAHLKEYLVKGFTLDDDRLKRPNPVVDYFDELLARIRDIRASEARLYQRVRDIFALAADYRHSDKAAQTFFATMQNKMIFAATGHTAAEIVRRRADADKPNMGLTAWAGGRVLKRDVGTSKNYLDPKEIDTLNRIVMMFLERAEFRAMRQKTTMMSDWALDLDNFLRFMELPVLASAGTVSHDTALAWAEDQYDTFAERRRQSAEEEAALGYDDELAAVAKQVEGLPKPKKRTPKNG